MQKWIEKLITQESGPIKASTFSDNRNKHIGSTSLLVGKNIAPLIDPQNKGPLLERIKRIQSQLLFETGINLNGIQLKNNSELNENAYAISIDGEILVEGVIHPGKSFFPYLRNELDHLADQGFTSINPVNGQEGVWVSESDSDLLIQKGHDSINIIDYIAFHFLIVIKQKHLFKERCKQLLFSERECEVVKCVIAGNSNSEVAETLFISESTVKQHMQNIFEKAKIGSRYELIKLF